MRLQIAKLSLTEGKIVEKYLGLALQMQELGYGIPLENVQASSEPSLGAGDKSKFQRQQRKKSKPGRHRHVNVFVSGDSYKAIHLYKALLTRQWLQVAVLK